MSLSGALYSAASGLSASQAMSRVTADNVANSMTEGYVRRSATLVSSDTGSGGVYVAEISREVDAALTRMSRNENSKMAEQQAIHEGLRDYTLFLGDIGDGTSPAEKFASFNSSLTTLVNMPSSSAAQQGVVYAAEDLAGTINDASDRLADVRADVDMEIRYEVAELNEKLYELKNLNMALSDFEVGTHESAAYYDQVDGVLDEISGITDIRVTYTSDGWVNVFTTGGAALIEGDHVQDVTYNAGDGSLYAGGYEITPNETGIRGIESGSLAGFITLKNETIPQFQLQLDEYARGLIETFQDADASLSVGQAGMFTDNGNAYDGVSLDGLASRLQVNDLLSSSSSSTAYLVRDGLGVTSEGEASSVTQIQAWIDALGTDMNADVGTGINADVSLADYGAEMVTAQNTETSRAEQSYNAALAAAEVIEASRANVEGVNIDEEMQNLLLIEQSFAANSKMLTAVSEMLDTLLAAV